MRKRSFDEKVAIVVALTVAGFLFATFMPAFGLVPLLDFQSSEVFETDTPLLSNSTP